MDQDSQYIQILSIFHFVVAGIAALAACFPIIHFMIGISMLAGSFFPNSAEAHTPFPFNMFGLLFTIIPGAMILFGWMFAITLALAGYFLLKRRHYLFCMVMAGISCAFTPFGTVLGVFTIVVLMRPPVKEQFNRVVVAA
jgi:hypothetical protein